MMTSPMTMNERQIVIRFLSVFILGGNAFPGSVACGFAKPQAAKFSWVRYLLAVFSSWGCLAFSSLVRLRATLARVIRSRTLSSTLTTISSELN